MLRSEDDPVRVEELEVRDGDVETDEPFGWDERFTPFVEWQSPSWPLFHRPGWLVWRGEKRWSVTPEMVERAWGLYRIGVRVSCPDGVTADLSDLRDHLPRMRSLRIDPWSEVVGYEELRRARALELLDIQEPEISEEADLSRLWGLRQYCGPSFGKWSSVLSLPGLEQLQVDEALSPIAGPVRFLALGSRRVSRLPELRQPSALRELHVQQAREFDLSSLLPATGLNVIDVMASRLVGLEALTKIPTLTEVTIEGRTEEDSAVLARMTAPEATLIIKPKPGPELIEASARKDWGLEVPDREMRAAYKALGRVFPVDAPTDLTTAVEAGDLRLAGPPYWGTLTSEAEDLPEGLSGTRAEELLVERIRALQGDEIADAIERHSTSDRMVVRFPTEIVWSQLVTDEAAALFAERAAEV